MEQAPALIDRFIRGHPPEAARVLENLALDEVVSFCGRIPPDLAAVLFDTMEAGAAAGCLERMQAGRAAEALSQVPLERAAALLRRLRPQAREAVLALLPPDPGRHLALLLSCRQDSAGALMDPRVLTLPPEVTAAEARGRMDARPEQATDCYYVVERDQTLAGVLGLRELLSAPPETPVSALMRRQVDGLRIDDSLASVRVHPGWLELHVLPVLDGRGRFAGALRHRTLRRLGEAHRPPRPDPVGAALGELYRIGLSALVKGALGEQRPGPPSGDRIEDSRQVPP